MTSLIDALLDPDMAYPCADGGLIAPIKKSAEYRAVRPRLTGPAPIDSWENEGLHYFVFQMRSEIGAIADTGGSVVLFTIRRGADGPVAVLIIAPNPDGDFVIITDLRNPDSPQRVNLH